jgi:hypothetical protein
VHAALQRNLVERPPMSDAFGVKGRAWLAERVERLPLDEQLWSSPYMRSRLKASGRWAGCVWEGGVGVRVARPYIGARWWDGAGGLIGVGKVRAARSACGQQWCARGKVERARWVRGVGP